MGKRLGQLQRTPQKLSAVSVSPHHESARVGYPLVEIISSGVANSKNLSFASIDFDSTESDLSIRVIIIKDARKVLVDRAWKLSELSHP